MDPSSLPKSPRENAGILSKLFFCWLVKLFRLGAQRDLELDDLYIVPADDRSQKLGNQLEEAWKLEISEAEEKNKLSRSAGGQKVKKPSLAKAIVKVFGLKYALLGIFAFSDECVVKIIQPIFLGYLLRYFDGEFGRREGLLFAGAVVLSSAIYTTQHHPFFFAIQHIGMKIRVAAASLVYRKAMTLSQASLGDTTIGQLVNFLSNDVNRFDMSVIHIHYIWIGPVQLGIVIFILWGHFGPACLAGAALLLFFIPFQTLMARLFGRFRLRVAEKTDRRIRIMNEVIGAMRVIKMYTWEIPFSKLVTGARSEEIDCVRKVANLRAINLSVFYVSSKLIVFITLLTYVLPGNYLTAEKVFVALSLYNNVRLVLTLFLPAGLSTLAETLVSIERIEKFLLMEDRVLPTPKKGPLSNGISQFRPNEIGIKVTNLSAKWSPSAEELTLSNISLEVKRGQLVAVIGTVGASKSSLLNAILRELPTVSGEISVSGDIAYVPQEAWIFTGSIRQNILFGKKYEPSWYSKVIDACALRMDLDLFPFGDQTIVGDRGASLSGGQKARVNLARAVYSKNDCILLDDPFSPLDASVGRQVFDKCIMGILKNKAVLLVTNQLHFLKPANQIILLNNGKVESQGSYTKLVESGIDFAQLLISGDDAGHEGPSLSRSPGFRRSASMNIMEMRGFGVYGIPEEFEVDSDERCMSVNMTKSVHNEKSMKSDLVLCPSFQKEYGTFVPSAESRKQASRFDETKSSGNIGLGLYWKYIRAGSNWLTLSLLVIMSIVTQVFFTGSDYWLQFWTKSEEARGDNPTNSTTDSGPDSSEPFLMDFYTELTTNRNLQIWIYCGIIAILFVASLLRTVGFFNMCMISSINLHKRLFAGVIVAPMRFFELNPVGRILNRFAKDIGICDEMLPPVLFDTVEIGLQVIGVLIIVSIVNPFLVIPACVLAVLFYFVRRFYLKCGRSIKRLEGVARSPVFTHLSSSLYGLTTIRAFGAEAEFVQQFDSHQDIHSSAWYLFLAMARWLGICVDWMSVLYIAVVTFSFMFVDTDSALVGLAISSSMTLTGLFQWGVRQSAEMENQMVSVERILDYSNLESEPPLESSPGLKPNKQWPSRGEIRVHNMNLRYGSDSPVLRDINFVIRPAEKVGIVGRTGAGKSSLITALFRLAPIESGSMTIDGVDIQRIGLHDLRSKMAIIPQDPVLFMGSLRRNLDPFSSYTDNEIYAVLDEVHLSQAVKEMTAGLDTEIAEGGQNFSVGERQLICLGRAVLRNSKIIVMDESTANVDPQTDALIQKTIRSKFAACTVLTVAHRLHTVMDSDRILLLDEGRIKEFDEPYTLLQDPSSALYQLVEKTGKSMAASLLKIASKAVEKRTASQPVPELNLNEDDNLSDLDAPDTSKDDSPLIL